MVVVPCLLVGYAALTNSSGAPAGRSGSPASGNTTCTACHSGPAITTQNISITTDIPSTGFAENTDYTITIMANNGGIGSRIGFEASVESANSSGFAGTVTAGTGNQKTGSYITHTSAGNTPTNNEKSWSFTWNSGTAADATVYVAVNFANGNNNTDGDAIGTKTLQLIKASGVGLEEEVDLSYTLYPNPVKDMLYLRGLSAKVDFFMVYNLSGKAVARFDNETQKEPGVWEFDASQLPTGTYILKSSEEKMTTKTFKKL